MAKPGGVRTKPAARTPPVRFVEADLPARLRESAHPSPTLEVLLPDGTVVRGSNATELAKLLRSLRA
jgi:hypothetical protein